MEIAIIKYEEEIQFILQLKVVAPAAFAYRERRGIFLYLGPLTSLTKLLQSSCNSVCIFWPRLHTTASLEHLTSKAGSL